jgi:hypothetical protein
MLPGIGNKTAENLWTQTASALAGGTDFQRLQGFKVPAKCAKTWEQFVHTLTDLVPSSGPLPPAAMMEAVLFAVYDDYMKTKFANYDARRDDLTTLAGFAAQFESTEEFLSQLALLGGVETADAFAGDADSEKITLSTLHQAKGLESRKSAASSTSASPAAKTNSTSPTPNSASTPATATISSAPPASSPNSPKPSWKPGKSASRLPRLAIHLFDLSAGTHLFFQVGNSECPAMVNP